jgi:hypothetical protein
MPIDYQKKVAVLRDVVPVDEAEGLLEWLQTRKAPKVDLGGCGHLHPANLQVLMAARVTVTRWPEDASLRAWLEPALNPEAKEV